MSLVILYTERSILQMLNIYMVRVEPYICIWHVCDGKTFFNLILMHVIWRKHNDYWKS